MTRRLLFVLSLFCLANVSAQEFPGADKIESKTLDNGLKIIVWPQYDIPNVAIYNWVRAGGRNEVPGITGLSHFFEHMMFNGTKTRAVGEFDTIMEAAGGTNNAYTSTDVTVYQDWFPNTALETIMELEGDRLANLSFDPKVIESERGVVFSERRSAVDNNNPGWLAEQVMATAFLAHPYQFPVIGWHSDIEAWTIEDLKSFFKTYYAPNNCTMIFVGAVEPDQVFALAEKYLAPIPSQALPEPIRTVEPPQSGERRLIAEKVAQTPLMQFAFHSPAAADEDSPALDLLMSILTRGNASRLHQVLVESEQAAISVSGFRYPEGFDPGLAWLWLTLPAGGDIDKADRLVSEVLAEVIEDGVTEAELAKAKNMMAADFWRGLSTINGKASALGNYEVFHGDYKKLFDIPKVYEAVTLEEVQAVAKEVFAKTNRTVGVLSPNGEES